MAVMASAPTAGVLVEYDEPRAYLTLNRPEKRNALSLALMEELHAALSAVEQNRTIQVVILQARGPVFSAGHDLSELVDRDLATYRHIFDTCVRLMEKIRSMPQPVIAAVHGPATAAGCQLVATCDLAVAADIAWFATPGVKIGLFCSTPMVAVSRAIPEKKMMEMLLTGEPMKAADALAAGLVNRVVPRDQVDAAARELSDKIAAMSPAVVAVGKQAFYRQREMPEHEAYAYTKEVMSVNAGMPEAHEGITAFLEKRAPRWKLT
jgi:enoyl-CoA hydratase/carnithine racemase